MNCRHEIMGRKAVCIHYLRRDFWISAMQLKSFIEPQGMEKQPLQVKSSTIENKLTRSSQATTVYGFQAEYGALASCFVAVQVVSVFFKPPCSAECADTATAQTYH